MSSRSTENITRPSTSASGRSDQQQDQIDQRLKSLRDEVLPFYPFFLTVPIEVPFQLGHRFVNNWAVSDDGPFTPEEHQLQYMTFLTHDQNDSLLVAVGDWSDGTGSVMADRGSRPQSATSTPSNGSIKKKISLHDYKNKRKNGGTSPSALNQEASGHKSSSTLHVPPHDRHNPKPLPTPDNHQKLSKAAAQSDIEHVDRKRPPERDNRRHVSQGKDAKKRKISPEPTHTRLERSDINGLPQLLSPTLPPTSSTPRLPRLLSPTLPPDLERELAKLGAEALASDSQAESTVNSDTVKPKETSASGPLKGPGKLSGLGLEKSVSTGPDTTSRSGTALKTVSQQPSSQTSNAKSSQAASKPPRLIVKLKYGRPNRKRVEGLLKFAGKRKMSHQSSPATDAGEQEASHSIKSEHPRLPAPESQSNKPIRPDKPARSSNQPSFKDRPKEHQLVAGSEKPQTPVQSHVQQQERTRPVSITPAKDLKHSSSRHDLANSEAKSRAAARNTPAESAFGISKQSPHQPSNVDRNGERRAWKDEYQKFGNLGRELKHAADRHTAKDNVTSADEKLAAATAIEAILCFILAFVADDQSKAISRQIGDSSTWLSIIAYWRVVKKHSFSFPPLYSLSLILGAVSYDAIHALDLERLAVTPLPGEHTPVPTPGSDRHSVNSDEKRTLKDFLELKTRLPEFYKESQRLWLDGSRGLSEDILARDFPETWAKRARTYSEQGKKKLKPGDYSGEIYLPLGKTSTPLEIIRFSCALLREWCSRENIDWRSKLDL
ncbi:hypothetical protein ASPCAL08147 [Aspergillus calidoustus]|uniref:Ell binding protein Ebp1 C-terminal domain-containing protein n=1 Tax=Aspergillus calidoustus TaxID=454130 RepID=A0A0U5GPF3_ASPCI|nr:hypothetical protein ASPCAL08147 [Aspergillus calidoustus]